MAYEDLRELFPKIVGMLAFILAIAVWFFPSCQRLVQRKTSKRIRSINPKAKHRFVICVVVSLLIGLVFYSRFELKFIKSQRESRIDEAKAKNPLYKSAMNLANELVELAGRQKPKLSINESQALYVLVSDKYERRLTELKLDFAKVNIVSDELAGLISFPSNKNEINSFTSANILNIAAEIKRLAEKL